MATDFKKTFVHWLPWLIIALGLILRVDQYLLNRSLWLDEAFIAVNFLDQSLIQLLQPPLDYSHYMNISLGFLAMGKLSVTLFGNSDLILRLFPFVCGVASLWLFYQMAKAYVSPKAVPLALLFFAISDSLIYYASEMKQYSSDVTIAILLFLLVAYVLKQSLTISKILLLALVGTLAVWFSHSSAFILAAIGGYLIVCYGFERQWKSMFTIAIISLMWLCSFLAMYLMTTGGGINEATPITEYHLQVWNSWDAFMPSPFSMTGLKWIYHNYFEMFDYPGSLGLTSVAGVVFIIGCIAMLGHQKQSLLLLTLPIVITVLVSFFYRYPFQGRMILFLLPSLYLILAEGLIQIQLRLLAYPKTAIVTIATQVILVAALIINLNPYQHTDQEIKPILSYLQTHQQAKDRVYLYHWAEPAFRYYAADYQFNYDDCDLITPIPKNEYTKEIDYFRGKRGLKPADVSETQCILGVSESFHQSQPDLEKLRHHGRVWVIFSHVVESEKMLFLKYLDNMGERLDEFHQPGSFVYLYQL